MCVILIVPDGVTVPRSILEACSQANPHGAGIAWRSRGEVRYRKTDDVAEIARLAKEVKGERVIHFRIASVGGVCRELRHPFPVTRRVGLADEGHAAAVLFQNGTWHDWREAVAEAQKRGHRVPEGPMSDARAAAWLIHIHGPEFVKGLGTSRWVLFAAKATSVHGRWDTVEGIRFSNLCWQRGAIGTPPHLEGASKGSLRAKPTLIAPSPQPATSRKPKKPLGVGPVSPGTQDYWDMISGRKRWVPK